MSFAFFALGCLFLVSGVAYLAYLMGIPQVYLTGTALLLVGIAAAGGLQRGRRRV